MTNRFRAAFSFCILLLASSISYAGAEKGNGGDYIALEFAQSAHAGYKVLKTFESRFPFIDWAKLETAMSTTEIKVLPFGQGFPDAIKTAKNFPKMNLIEINSDRWSQIRSNQQKMALSLHEYLGLLGYEVNNYMITSRIFGLSEDKIEALPTFAEIEKSLQSKKSLYDKLLAKAASLKPSEPHAKGESITHEECLNFMKNKDTNIQGRPGLFYGYFWPGSPSYAGHKLNACYHGINDWQVRSVNKHTSLGMHYVKVLSYNQGGDRILLDGFGKVVEVSRESRQQRGELIELETAVSTINQKGDVYHNYYTEYFDKSGAKACHDWIIDREKKCLHQKLEANVILADGSNWVGSESNNRFIRRATSLRSHTFINGDIYLKELTHSASDNNDWTEFKIVTPVPLSEPIAGNLYFTQWQPGPENGRTISYTTLNGITSVTAGYVFRNIYYEIAQ